MNSKKWKYSEDFKCYVKQDNPFQPPSSYALGDKYLYWQAGIDTNGSVLRGSTISDWGGYHFGIDLQKAIMWLIKEAKQDTTHWIENY